MANGRIRQEETIFMLCDMQEKFRAAISFFQDITEASKRLAAELLKIPVLVSEQNPKALGDTIAELKALLVVDKTRDDCSLIVVKTLFSMVVPEIEQRLKDSAAHRRTIVLFGIETHICILQTALDLVARGYNVHVVADAASSRNQVDRHFAFERLRQSGVFITTTESVLFQLLGDATHPRFKEIQKLIIAGLSGSGLLPGKI